MLQLWVGYAYGHIRDPRFRSIYTRDLYHGESVVIDARGGRVL